MVENIEIIVSLIILIFTLIVIITVAISLVSVVKHNRRATSERKSASQASMFLTIDSEEIKKEMIKAMRAIDAGIIVNEKQVNHAENHNDIKEVEKFSIYNEYDVFDIAEIGETVYGKY